MGGQIEILRQIGMRRVSVDALNPRLGALVSALGSLARLSVVGVLVGLSVAASAAASVPGPHEAMSLVGGGGAPLGIDPFFSQSTLSGSGAIGPSSFGDSVTLSADGNTALVGDLLDNEVVGAAWVFTRSGSTWSQQGAKLALPGPHINRFGVSVALSADGNTAIIGAPETFEANNVAYGGRVFVYTRSGGTWSPQATLIALHGGEEAEFGSSVSLSADGNTALIGAPNESGAGSGEVYVFGRSGATWTEQSSFAGSGPGTSGKWGYGQRVALSSDGTTALFTGFRYPGTAAVWLFKRSGSDWLQQGEPLEENSERFHLGGGIAISPDGNTALIGGVNTITRRGAAWIFTPPGVIWTQEGPPLEAEDTWVGSRPETVPTAIALSPDGNTALMGYTGERVARVFTRSGFTWSQQSERFWGSAVALSADATTALIGEPFGTISDGSTQGATVYTTSVAPPPPSYVALGDSYSSGEGNPPYEVGTAMSGWDTCHRSESAFAPLLDAIRGLGGMTFAACSGARTNDLFVGSAANHEVPQLTRLSAPNTKTVTLTIGGDDVGFVEVLEHCVEGFRPPDTGWVYWQGAECSTNQQLRDLITARLKVLEGTASPLTLTNGPPVHPLSEVFAHIHAAAPAARIVVGGYPQLFGSKTKMYTPRPTSANLAERACGVWPTPGLLALYWVRYPDARWLNEEAQKLDSVIQAAAVAARKAHIPVYYAPPSAFKGHALCDSGQAWIHPLEIAGALEVEKGSFHPTVSGEQLGYEPAFAKKLK